MISDGVSPPRGADFPRAVRVRASGDFKRVFDGGRRVAHPLLSLHRLASAQPARLGLAVSRKVDPHAVGRNRIKRVLRDVFRKLRHELEPGDYVVVARPAARSSEATALRAALQGVLLRTGALPPSVAPGTMPPSAQATSLVTHASLPSMPRPGAG